MKEKLLLIIDPNNDFTDPRGALYVPGADFTTENLREFLVKNKDFDVIVSQDTHWVYNIGHSSFWTPNPKPFEKITVKDLQEFKYKPRYFEELKDVEIYLEKVKEITIWPNHCIKGSWGWEINESLLEVLPTDAMIFEKGINPTSEMYSVFNTRDEPMNPNLRNQGIPIFSSIEDYSEIVVAGQAKDYCVYHSLKSLLDYFGKQIIPKITILSDCTPAIDPQSETNSFYEQFKNIISTDYYE